MPRFIRTFTIILIGLIATGCALTPALHVIGVYEGQTRPDSDDRPWWAKCNDDQQDKPTSAIHASPSFDCHQKNADIHVEKEITVSVSDESRPIVLALTAYERTLWKVSPTKGVKIRKVILAGYHSQRVSGIPPETSIETYTYDPSPCELCRQGGKYFYSYQGPPGQLKEITGLEVTSFQGRYSGSEFFILPGNQKME